jgi:hypothetical protein
VAIWLDRHGLEGSTEQMTEILNEVKGQSLAKKRLLDDEEFLTIAKSVLGR